MNAANDLLQLALQLPPPERASIARQLLLSLESDPPDADYDESWQSEINARLARVESGNYSAVGWQEAMTRIRQTLRQGSPS